MEMMDKVDKQKRCSEMMDRDEYRTSITVSQRCFADAFRISSNKSVCNQKSLLCITCDEKQSADDGVMAV